MSLSRWFDCQQHGWWVGCLVGLFDDWFPNQARSIVSNMIGRLGVWLDGWMIYIATNLVNIAAVCLAGLCVNWMDGVSALWLVR